MELCHHALLQRALLLLQLRLLPLEQSLLLLHVLLELVVHVRLELLLPHLEDHKNTKTISTARNPTH